MGWWVVFCPFSFLLFVFPAGCCLYTPCRPLGSWWALLLLFQYILLFTHKKKCSKFIGNRSSFESEDIKLKIDVLNTKIKLKSR